MNERIRELAEQSGMVQGGWANTDKVKIWKENPDNPGSLEKFASLIVQECVDIADDYDGVGSTIVSRIKQHFGIEPGVEI